MFPLSRSRARAYQQRVGISATGAMAPPEPPSTSPLPMDMDFQPRHTWQLRKRKGVWARSWSRDQEERGWGERGKGTVAGEEAPADVA